MKIVARIAAAFFLLASTAAIAAPAPAVLTPDDKALLARIEAYLTAVTTLDARFLQLANGRIAEGQVRMSRPGKMRIDYDPPVPVQMTANGIWVLYFDKKLNQTSYIPSAKTPLAFLLREQVKLDDRVIVTKVDRAAAAARVSLVLKDSPDAGTLTIVFEDSPLRLIKWELIDTAGTRIEVALLDPRFGVALDSALFDIADPRPADIRE